MATPRELKVGAFVLLGLFAIGVVIFLIGEERALFQRKQDYQIVFSDVEGLKRGSPVRMGGVDVGSVAGVRYAADPSDPKLYVTIRVVREQAVRIREDSTAVISDKGLLGDKMITLTIGSAQKSPIPEGGTIPTGEQKGLSDLLGTIGSVGQKAEKVVTNLEKTATTLGERQFQEDLKTTVRSLASISKKLDTGEGYAARLLSDAEEADKLSRTLANLERSSAELSRALRGVGTAVDRVNSGPGFAHDLLYGEGPSKAVGQFGDAAGELALTLRGIREGNGLAKSVLYGDDRTQQLMGDINAISSDVRSIVAGVKQGRGTFGALLVDPSVYEDLKVVLGNVSRNKALRALVRWSISRDETQPRVRAEAPGPEPAPGSAAQRSDEAPAAKSDVAPGGKSAGYTVPPPR